jgi:hypothetical protein
MAVRRMAGRRVHARDTVRHVNGRNASQDWHLGVPALASRRTSFLAAPRLRNECGASQTRIRHSFTSSSPLQIAHGTTKWTTSTPVWSRLLSKYHVSTEMCMQQGGGHRSLGCIILSTTIDYRLPSTSRASQSVPGGHTGWGRTDPRPGR